MVISMIWLVICCEAITEIIGSSDLFNPIRSYFINRDTIFFSQLFTCKYCLSMWTSILICTLAYVEFNNIIYYIIGIFVVHRLSNIFHIVIDILYNFKFKMINY